jgi:hypothetical protein
MRTQALSFFIFKLRSQQELDALLDEVSALGGRKLVDSFYQRSDEETVFLPVHTPGPTGADVHGTVQTSSWTP